MEKDALLKHIAPCSLLCYTCSGYKYGIISQLARELLHYTQGLTEFYAKHPPADRLGACEEIRCFRQQLLQHRDGNCEGCRGGKHNGCSIKGCFLNECVLEQGVDFCGQCPKFPCTKIGGLFEEAVFLQWLEGNRQIKEMGPQSYYEMKKHQSHYGAYTKQSPDLPGGGAYSKGNYHPE